VQSSCQIITTNKPTSSFFYRPDALPVAQPTVSKHWREHITFHGLAYPKLIWGLPTLSLTTDNSWLPWGGLPCLSSALWCQYPLGGWWFTCLKDDTHPTTNRARCTAALLIETSAHYHCVKNWDEESTSKSLTLRLLLAIFPGGLGLVGASMSPLWILLELKMLEVVVTLTTGAIRHAKLQSNRHQQTNAHHFTGRMPSLLPSQQCQRKWSKWRRNIKRATG